MTRDTVFIVDAMNYIFRAFHALPREIAAPSGMMTNAVLGYVRTLVRLIKEHKPTHMAAAFEGARSFRNEVFPDYKANRADPPDELYPQFSYCRRMTDAMGIASFAVETYEADDVIGTLAELMAGADRDVVIVTGDKDMSQLVGPGVRVYDMAKELWLDETGVVARFGVRPQQIPDMLALLGDAIDNIPGVTGIGEKSARQILSVCPSLEDLLADRSRDHHIQIRNRRELLDRIRTNVDAVRRSRQLATICRDVPLGIDPEDIRYRGGHWQTLEPLCRELGFKRLQDEIPIGQNTLF